MSDCTLADEITQLMEVALDPDLRGDLDQILGDYSHQCRNRLNSLKLSLYLAQRQMIDQPPISWRMLEDDYRSLESRLDLIQLLFRPLDLTLVSLPLNLLIEDRQSLWLRMMQGRGHLLHFVPPHGQTEAKFDVTRLGEALDGPRQVAVRAGGALRASVDPVVDSGRPYLHSVVRIAVLLGWRV